MLSGQDWVRRSRQARDRPHLLISQAHKRRQVGGMGSPSATGNQPDAGRPPRGGRVPQQRGDRAGGSALARPRRADLAVVASNAVVTYLRQATERPAEQDAALDQESAPDLAMSGILAAGADP